jgi:hypothetical protein
MFPERWREGLATCTNKLSTLCRPCPSRLWPRQPCLARTRASLIQSRYRRWPIPMIQSWERKSFLVARHFPHRWQLIQSVSMPRVVLPAHRRFRSMARLGKSCGCRATAIGRIPICRPAGAIVRQSARGRGLARIAEAVNGTIRASPANNSRAVAGGLSANPVGALSSGLRWRFSVPSSTSSKTSRQPRLT